MGLEDTLFDWESWDEVDTVGGLQFTGCTFKRNVGPFKAGDKVEAISIHFCDSKMYVYNDGKELCFKLWLTVGSGM